MVVPIGIGLLLLLLLLLLLHACGFGLCVFFGGVDVCVVGILLFISTSGN